MQQIRIWRAKQKKCFLLGARNPPCRRRGLECLVFSERSRGELLFSV